MIAVSIAEVVGLPMRQSAQDRDVIAHRSQRAEDRRQFEIPPGRLRHPHRLNRAVRNIDESQSYRGLDRPRGQRRHHGVEKRQRHRCAYAAQKRPSWQCPLGDDHELSPPGSGSAFRLRVRTWNLEQEP
jgi:hypothetical protein